MSYKDYEKSLDLIRENKGLLIESKGASKETIELAEKKLNINFSYLYNKFLMDFGVLYFDDLEIYGIVNDEIGEEIGTPDAIWYTLDERKGMNLPENLIIIANFGEGELYCLDLNNINKTNGEPKVIIYIPGYGLDEQPNEIIAEDFGEFLYNQLSLILID